MLHAQDSVAINVYCTDACLRAIDVEYTDFLFDSCKKYSLYNTQGYGVMGVKTTLLRET